MPSLLHLR